MRLLTFLAAGFLAAMGQAALAQQGPPDGFSAGISFTEATNPYVGEANETFPIPLISYRNGPFELSTNGLGYQVYDDGPFSVTLGLRPRFTGLLSTDGPELEGIDRNVTGDAAIEARYDRGFAFVAAALRQEVTGEHEGQEARLRVGARARLAPRTALVFDVGAAWQSDDLSRYIWGVNAEEARVDRPAFSPGEVIVPFSSLTMRTAISDTGSLITSVRVDFLPEDVTDSPIIEDETIVAVFLGLSWQF
ncbi:MAG: MipA/OmpV family protein [Pseudomonadota bacterium]